MTADPLANDAARMIAHMNEDHADANLAYAQVLCGISDATEARIVAIDRHGIELIATTPAGEHQARLDFDEPAESPDAAVRALIALLERARAAT